LFITKKKITLKNLVSHVHKINDLNTNHFHRVFLNNRKLQKLNIFHGNVQEHRSRNNKQKKSYFTRKCPLGVYLSNINLNGSMIFGTNESTSGGAKNTLKCLRNNMLVHVHTIYEEHKDLQTFLRRSPFFPELYHSLAFRQRSNVTTTRATRCWGSFILCVTGSLQTPNLIYMLLQ
jgi:hypothetical protein